MFENRLHDYETELNIISKNYKNFALINTAFISCYLDNKNVEDVELEIDDDMTKGRMKNAFVKSRKNKIGNNSGWMVITTGWALAVYVAVVVTESYSGAHINPAVSIGLAIAGEFPWKSVPSYILAQMIGAMVGAFAVWLVYKKHFDATKDVESKKAVFCTAPAIPLGENRTTPKTISP